MHEYIAPLFGLTFNIGAWNQGFVVSGKRVFLLVTFDKGGLNEDHRYDDRFFAPDRFQWQSQNRTKQESSHGQIIHDHKKQGIEVHLFVSKRKFVDGKGSPFVYCGNVEFIDWHRDQPITVEWKLPEPVSQTQLMSLEPVIDFLGQFQAFLLFLPQKRRFRHLGSQK